MDFKTWMKFNRPNIEVGSELWSSMRQVWDINYTPETDGRTMTEVDLDLAVGHITSFYQSKRSKLKKQLTHWIGKFSIIKQENNVLRRKLLKAQCLVCMYEHVGYGKEVDKAVLQDAVKKIERAVHTKEPLQC
jgi:hypothetical protein